MLRELESTARAQQAAAKERAQQAAEQDMAEKREAADRVAAELLEEEEREEAAKTKVRVAPPSPHIGLHSVQLSGERCGVSVARVSASPLTAWRARGMGRTTEQEGQRQGQGWQRRSGWRVHQGGGGGGK